MKRYLSIIILGIGFLFSIDASAQISILGGGNLNTVNSDVELKNKESLIGYHFGSQLQYYPVKKWEKWSLINEFIFIKKGYVQQFEKAYNFHFNYLALPILVNYSPISFLSVQGGVELSKLASTNVKYGLDTYNTFDVGLAFGITAFDNRRIGIYSRVTYGLSPMLEYVQMDEMGNFIKEINDIHNFSYSLGIKIKLLNERIEF